MQVLKKIGQILEIRKKDSTRISLAQIGQGFSQIKELLFLRNDDEFAVYDRVCGHNHGTLCLRSDIAFYSMHGWSLDKYIFDKVQLWGSK